MIVAAAVVVALDTAAVIVVVFIVDAVGVAVAACAVFVFQHCTMSPIEKR